MKLTMRPGGFCWGRPLPLLDQNGGTRYTINSDPYAPGRPLFVLDLAGRRAAYIRNVMPSLLPRYEIEAYGKPVAELIRDITCAPPRLRIVSPADWRVHGSTARCNYDILRQDAIIASCRPLPRGGGLLLLDLCRQESAPAALGMMTVINCVLSPQTVNGLGTNG